MAKKAKKRDRILDFDAFDDFDDLYDDDIELKALTGRFYHPEWEQDLDSESRITARRKIERRRDMQKLYSQLDEWEEFGDHINW